MDIIHNKWRSISKNLISTLWCFCQVIFYWIKLVEKTITLTKMCFDSLFSNSLAATVKKILMISPKPNFPVDTGRKLNVHETFRKSPGRLLNVLCTSNYIMCPLGYFSVAIFYLRFSEELIQNLTIKVTPWRLN